jgi:hypothetical protein
MGIGLIILGPAIFIGAERLSALGGNIAERTFRQSDRIRVNERIRAREIRVIDE